MRERYRSLLKLLLFREPPAHARRPKLLAKEKACSPARREKFSSDYPYRAPCSFRSAPPAPKLPANLAERLEISAARCGFKLYSSHAAERLQADDGFVKKVADVARADIARVRTKGLATSGLAVTSWLAGALGSARGNLSVGFVGFGASASVIETKPKFSATEADREKAWSFDEGELDKAATKTAASLAKLVNLDPARENALRSDLMKTVRRRLERHVDEPVNAVEVMKRAKYRGQPLLSEDQLFAFAEVDRVQGDYEGKTKMTETQQANFLDICRVAVREQAAHYQNAVAKDLLEVAADADATIADLHVLIRTRPEYRELLPAPPRPAGGPAPAGGDTSMNLNP